MRVEQAHGVMVPSLAGTSRSWFHDCACTIRHGIAMYELSFGKWRICIRRQCCEYVQDQPGTAPIIVGSFAPSLPSVRIRSARTTHISLSRLRLPNQLRRSYVLSFCTNRRLLKSLFSIPALDCLYRDRLGAPLIKPDSGNDYPCGLR